MKKLILFILSFVLILHLHNTHAETITLYPTDDAYVDSSTPNKTYGTSELLYDNDQATDEWAFFRFDLRNYSEVKSAHLFLFIGDISHTQNSRHCCYLYSSDDFDENNITWYKRPLISDANRIENITILTPEFIFFKCPTFGANIYIGHFDQWDYLEWDISNLTGKYSNIFNERIFRR